MYPSETSNLFLIDPDGKDQRQLTDAPAGGQVRIAHAAWEPDGSRLWVSYVRGEDFRPGWVDPVTGSVTALDLTGSRPLPRPIP